MKVSVSAGSMSLWLEASEGKLGNPERRTESVLICVFSWDSSTIRENEIRTGFSLQRLIIIKRKKGKMSDIKHMDTRCSVILKPCVLEEKSDIPSHRESASLVRQKFLALRSTWLISFT